MANGSDGTLSQADIDELLSGTEEDADNKDQEGDPSAGVLAGSNLGMDAGGDSDLDSLLSPSTEESPIIPSKARSKGKKQAKGISNSELENTENMELLLDVKMNLSVEIGRTRMKMKEVLNLGSGAIVELDKLNGELVDVMVNNRLVARGEVVAVDETFGVKVVEIIDPIEREKIEL